MFYQIYAVCQITGEVELLLNKEFECYDEACAVAYRMGKDLTNVKLEVAGWSYDTE